MLRIEQQQLLNCKKKQVKLRRGWGHWNAQNWTKTTGKMEKQVKTEKRLDSLECLKLDMSIQWIRKQVKNEKRLDSPERLELEKSNC